MLGMLAPNSSTASHLPNIQRHASSMSQRNFEIHACCIVAFPTCSQWNTVFLLAPEELLQELTSKFGHFLQHH